jgi:hypothetical protein
MSHISSGHISRKVNLWQRQMATKNIEKGQPCEQSTFTEVTSYWERSHISSGHMSRLVILWQRQKGHLMAARNIEKGHPCRQSRGDLGKVDHQGKVILLICFVSSLRGFLWLIIILTFYVSPYFEEANIIFSPLIFKRHWHNKMLGLYFFFIFCKNESIFYSHRVCLERSF